MPLPRTPTTPTSLLTGATGRTAALAAALLMAPLAQAADRLSLPADTSVGVELVDTLSLAGDDARQEGILLRPADLNQASHTLPEYCVIVGDAQRHDARIRIQPHDVTCIETDAADSSIFSGELDASVYGDDGNYGIGCDTGACKLDSGHTFTLTLESPLDITEQRNPSAEINKERRQANGDGVANPIPEERPDPEAGN